MSKKPTPVTNASGRAGSNKPAGRQLIASNRKARHDYAILDTFEAGISLTGTEVKSLRAGRASLVDGYATVSDNEVWLRGVHNAEYAEGTWTNHAPRRARKLLLHRQEIRKLIGKTVEKGMTLVPVRMYLKDGHIKIAISLAKGKKAHDKRETIKRRETDRETRAAVKERR